jgi:5-methylcytosine-specific restriction endonuclease McrA
MLRQACYAVVYRRAKGRCERCGIAVSGKRPLGHPQRAEMNHKVPRSRGGRDDPDNCELICHACHMPDGQHAPTKTRMETLRKHRKDDWL